MAIWRKPLQFINVMLANRSPMSVAERGSGRMTYAKKKNPLQNTTCASRLSAQVITYPTPLSTGLPSSVCVVNCDEISRRLSNLGNASRKGPAVNGISRGMYYLPPAFHNTVRPILLKRLLRIITHHSLTVLNLKKGKTRNVVKYIY